ncbi:MAG: PilN domain-containing protein [Candidatus Saccharimonadales bacterium]
MINLLPPQHAAAIRYGRQNTVLRRWLLGMAAAVAGLVVLLSGGWVYMNSQTKNIQADVNVTNQQLQAQDLSKVQSDAKEITGDIKVINQVLSQEIRFSDLIQAIGNDMPPGTVLGSLSLSNKISGALDLSASATNYASATQVAVNLSNSQNNLFSRLDIISIQCSSGSTQTYKCTATLRALFSNAAKTKFLSVPSGDSS